MLRLLKYEMRKTLFPKLVLLALLVITEGIFLYGHWAGKSNRATVGLALFLFTLMFGFLVIGILSLVTLHKDMNTRQGYMLFMTPNSTYTILGAKVAECGLSLLVFGGIGLAVSAMNISLLQQEIDFISAFLRNFSPDLVPSVPNLAALLVYILSNILCSVTSAYLADVISSSLLNGKKGNLLITFLLFLVINYGVQKITGLVPATLAVTTMLLLQGLVALVLGIVMYIITAKLMENYLSV